MVQQPQQEAIALWIKPSSAAEAGSSQDFQWAHSLQKDVNESNQAFMAKVIAGLAIAKDQSDKFLTPLVEARKRELGQGGNNNNAGAKPTTGMDVD